MKALLFAQLVYLNGVVAEPASSSVPPSYRFYLVVFVVAILLGVWLGWIVWGEPKPARPMPRRPARTRAPWQTNDDVPELEAGPRAEV